MKKAKNEDFEVVASVIADGAKIWVQLVAIEADEFEDMCKKYAECMKERDTLIGIPRFYIAGSDPPKVWPQPGEGVTVHVVR